MDNLEQDAASTAPPRSKPGPKGPRRELTMREERLVQGLLDGKTQTQAALDAGYGNGHPNHAAQTANKKLADSNFRQKLLARALERGIGIDYALDNLDRVIHVRRKGVTREGDVVDLGDDGNAQAKGVDMLLRMMGAYPDPRLEVDHNVRAQVVVLREQDVIEGDPFAAVVDGEARELDAGT